MNIRELRPFISILMIIGTMFVLVFSKMEVRRLGYGVLRVSRIYKEKLEQRRVNEMQLAHLVRPDRIESYAHDRLALKTANKGQIIQISGQTIALQQ